MEQWFPWERLPEETGPAWAAFVAYRDLGPSRTLEKAAKTLGKHSSTLSEFGRKWQWEPRVRAWDAEVDKTRRAEFLKVQVRMVRTHLKNAAKLRELAVATLDIMDAGTMLYTGPDGAPQPRNALAFLQAAIKIEQAALGLPAEPMQNPNADKDPIDVYFDNLDQHELLKQTKTAATVIESQLQLEESKHASKPAKRDRASRPAKGK